MATTNKEPARGCGNVIGAHMLIGERVVEIEVLERRLVDIEASKSRLER